MHPGPLDPTKPPTFGQASNSYSVRGIHDLLERLEENVPPPHREEDKDPPLSPKYSSHAGRSSPPTTANTLKPGDRTSGMKGLPKDTLLYFALRHSLPVDPAVFRLAM